MRLLAVTAALSVFALTPTSARAGSISGAFVEKPSGSPLASVEVVVRRAADSTVVAHTTTAEDGRFRLDGLPLERLLLRASLVGYASYVRNDITLTDAAPVLELGTLSLVVAPVELKGVTTSAAKATAIITPDRNIYLTKDMPAAAAGTATDLLRAVPELDVDIDGRASLRGSSSVTIQFNGRATPLTGDALNTYLRQFPANRIERIEVIANPSARFNPEGTAGIVNIVLKEGVNLGLSGSVYLSAGTRSTGPGARVAWQKGPVTLFTGLSGYWNNNHSALDDARTNLFSQSARYYRLNTGSDYRSGGGFSDASLDLALSKRSTLYTALNGYLNANRYDALTHYALLDSTMTPTTRYDRATAGRFDGRTGTVSLGFRHVVKQGRDERSIELRQSDNQYDNGYDATQHVFVPVDSAGPTSRQAGATGWHERSLEADDTHPLGAKGKLEVGFRGSDRHNSSSSALRFFDGQTAVVTPQTSTSDYVHREIFQSGYVTLGSTFGKASLQLGARAEAAHTTFDVRTTRTGYRNDYRSVFPSANAVWDFGKGRTARFSYSKRIERPSPGYLNPDIPSLDPLNRTVGNPFLKPKYTHSFSVDASWMGSRGSIRVSPYYRKTVGNWDQYKLVDSTGAATTTWLNASSIGFLGASFTVSLRQTKRLGGTLSASVYRERHDATNLVGQFKREATNWSGNGNVTYKLLEPLDLQGSLRYNPAQTLAQGRISAILFTNIGARLKLGKQASAGLWVNDPFNLWKYELVTKDGSHEQATSSRYTVRSATLNLSWTWGKPPEQKPRRQTNDQPTQDPAVPTP